MDDFLDFCKSIRIKLDDDTKYDWSKYRGFTTYHPSLDTHGNYSSICSQLKVDIISYLELIVCPDKTMTFLLWLNRKWCLPKVLIRYEIAKHLNQMSYIANIFTELSLRFCYVRKILGLVFYDIYPGDTTGLLSLLNQTWYCGFYPLLVKHPTLKQHLVSSKAKSEWEKLMQYHLNYIKSGH